jgi:hypothetical protein
MVKKFQRNIENFTCEHCGAFVIGNGYTNHCPRCLWGKHVDINPGDRSNPCKGLMRPIGVETKGSEYIIIHQCEKCRTTKRNKASEHDDFEDILALSTKQ